ncbi:DUF2911 domain-containing protein [Hymenobacter endophyticus]|uniref:DUF2911 domain-containing protein n=1 Tax=Hymenobacter endophyticus TaxID=3076335 RepID=A0ABU3TF96_9BACT|nr:DUF2911 domain-containing protein [Hymenobacter endophyticus]MDU0370051.1 DUF2911 domain-containing protein [Hymenobacter endophyticus]
MPFLFTRLSQLSVRVLLALLVPLAACSEPDKPQQAPTRPSPPATVAASLPGGAQLVIRYSRPSAKERKVFGGLVPYGQVWRTGANEATTFEVNQPVTVQGQSLPAGKYALFTIPTEKDWTIIFNKTATQWGAYEYEAADDVLRVKAMPASSPQPLERFTINATNAGQVTLAWEKTQVSFVVK